MVLVKFSESYIHIYTPWMALKDPYIFELSSFDHRILYAFSRIGQHLKPKLIEHTESHLYILFPIWENWINYSLAIKDEKPGARLCARQSSRDVRWICVSKFWIVIIYEQCHSMKSTRLRSSCWGSHLQVSLNWIAPKCGPWSYILGIFAFHSAAIFSKHAH